MMELGASEIDELMCEALAAMPGLAFTRAQLLLHMQNLAEDIDALRIVSVQAQFSQAFRKMTVPLAVPGSSKRRRFRLHGQQSRAYVRTPPRRQPVRPDER